MSTAILLCLLGINRKSSPKQTSCSTDITNIVICCSFPLHNLAMKKQLFHLQAPTKKKKKYSRLFLYPLFCTLLVITVDDHFSQFSHLWITLTALPSTALFIRCLLPRYRLFTTSSFHAHDYLIFSSKNLTPSSPLDSFHFQTYFFSIMLFPLRKNLANHPRKSFTILLQISPKVLLWCVTRLLMH